MLLVVCFRETYFYAEGILYLRVVGDLFSNAMNQNKATQNVKY
jgi:hypothetical protein